MSGMQLIDLQLPNRVTTTDFGLQFLPSKYRSLSNSVVIEFIFTQHTLVIEKLLDHVTDGKANSESGVCKL